MKNYGYLCLMVMLMLLSSTARLLSFRVKGEVLEEVTIGVIFPYSEDEENLARLIHWAQEDINQYMEANGHAYRFDFLLKNAQSTSSKHREEVENLRNMGVDLIIGGAWSSQAEGSIYFVNAMDMLLLSPSSTSPTLEIPDDNLYRMCPPSSAQASIMAEMLWSYGIEACVVIQRSDYWDDDSYYLFSDNYERAGGTVFDRILFNDGDPYPEFLEEANSIASQAVVDYGSEKVGIVILCWTSDLIYILDHAQDQPTLNGLKWFGGEGLAKMWNILEIASEQADHLKLFSLLETPANNSQYHVINERFHDETGEDLPFYGSNWYDACWIYSLSVIEIDSAEAIDVEKVLLRVSYSYTGAGGPFILDENGDKLTGAHDIWGYGFDDKEEPIFVKYGYFDPILAEVTWTPDLNRPTPSVNDELVVNSNGPYTAISGEQVLFSSTGSRNPSGDIEAYRWSFGDGVFSYGENVVHTYHAPGTYTVTLKLTDEDDAIKTDTTFCIVQLPPNEAPVASLNGPYSGSTGEMIIFNSSGTQDSDGRIAEYRWDFGDESGYGYGAMTNHTYSTTGVFPITLTIIDNQGAESTGETYCVVSDQPNVEPVVNMNGPYRGNIEAPVRFNSTGTYDPDGTIIGYRWDFGDGSGYDYVENPSHTYPEIGIYQVTFTVTDNRRVSINATTTCTIFDPSNKAPAAVSNGPYEGFAGYPISFKSTGSDDPDGKINMYEWSFGDGTLSESVNPRHTYSSNGTYTVTLRVTDNEGAEDSTTTVCIVAPWNIWGVIRNAFGSIQDPNKWSIEVFASVFAVLITFIGGTVGIVRWGGNYRKRIKVKRRTFQEYLERVDEIYTQYKMNSRQCEAELYKLKTRVIDDFKQDIIDEKKFNILDKRIDEYILEIREELLRSRLIELQDRLGGELQRIVERGNFGDEEFDALEKMVDEAPGIAAEERSELKALIADWRSEHLRR